ncbi:MAG: hypothetical protein ACLSG6_02120 [Fusicatenibacter saccharivorans]
MQLAEMVFQTRSSV